MVARETTFCVATVTIASILGERIGFIQEDTMPSEKYKEFRNFMFNELGISKDDIRQWTREAAFEAAERQARSVDVEGIVARLLTQKVRDTISPSYGRPSTAVRDEIKKAVAEIMADKIVLSLKEDSG